MLCAIVLCLAGCNANEESEAFHDHDITGEYTKELSNERSGGSGVARRNKGTAIRFLRLLEKGKIDALVRLFAKNGRQVNPYATGILPEGAVGREALFEYWEPLPQVTDSVKFIVQEVYALEDPNIIFMRYDGRIKLKANPVLYQNNYYATFRFNERGKIVEFAEIFNPIIAARALGLVDLIE